MEDAARVVTVRAGAVAALAGSGGMVSVPEPEAAVRERIAAWGGRLRVAAVNAPGQVVVAGDAKAVAELVAVCEEQGIRAWWVSADYASHTSAAEGVREQVLNGLAGISPRAGRVPLWSTVTGELADGAGMDAGYWYENLRRPVRFAPVAQALAGQPCAGFIEISPRPVLTAALAEIVDQVAGERKPAVAGSLRRGQGGLDRLLAALAAAHVAGINVDWTAVLAGTGARRVPLPTYAFQHRRYWPRASTAAAGDVTAAGLGATGHPLLGAMVEPADGDGLLFTGRLSLRAQPWLADHAVAGTVLLPGTGFVELALCAARQAGCGWVEELTLQAPLVVSGAGGVCLQVTVGGRGADGRREISVHSRPEGSLPGDPWTRHASGTLALQGPAAAGQASGLVVWPPPGAAVIDTGGLYERLAGQGYEYGPVFQGLRAAWRRGEELFAEAVLPEAAEPGAGSFGVHPALLDAVLHALGADDGGMLGRDGIVLPFSWAGVSLHAAGAGVLRARLAPAGPDAVSVTVADGAGGLVAVVDSLMLRPLSPGGLSAAGGGAGDLFGVEWAPAGGDTVAGLRWAVAGADQLGVAAALAAVGAEVERYPDATALAAATAGTGPDVVVVSAASAAGGAANAAGAAEQVTCAVLGVVRGWLGEPGLGGSRLVVATRGAVAAGPAERITDLAGAAAWGLARSVQSENPGRVILADLDPGAGPDAVAAGLTAAVAAAVPEIAVRGGQLLVPRLARVGARPLPVPESGAWRLDAVVPGSIDGLALAGSDAGTVPLGPGQVRVAVRAAGLNFRDVLASLGMLPGEVIIGSEIAGVVSETGPEVAGLAAGDSVLGMAAGGVGPVAVADARTLAKIPAGWSFAQAAGVPIAFLTAYYGLVDLARLRAGEKVLIHAATGGVGMAAVQLARHLGAEVFGTASPGKHAVLAGLGLDAAHTASSRDLGFAGKWAKARIDVVLDCLAGEFVDASLDLLGPGGRFIEMGRTDIRDPAQVAENHPGVGYRAFGLAEAGPDRIGQMLAALLDLLTAGELAVLPVRAWDVRRAVEAFRFMQQARHTGKIVLTIPRAPDPAGTILITGGTGTLGAALATHLAAGGARHLLLASRSGPAAAGAARLAATLAEAGTRVQITACDIGDRRQAAALLAGISADAPLTAVIHTAGVLDDGVAGSLSPEKVARVWRPKAAAAWQLHELTAGTDLAAFVLFSSVAGTFGSAGQGNYAAANAFLDALAAARGTAGLPGQSLAWGLWEQASGTAHLDQAQVARLRRTGLRPMTTAEGLALFDAATARDETFLVPAPLETAALRAQAADGTLPAIFHGLIRTRALRAATAMAAESKSLRHQLAAMPAGDQDRMLTELIRAQAAAILEYASTEAIPAAQTFRDLGFDSLTSVELRNRLATATGLRLPATLVFDHPTPKVLAGRLRAELLGEQASTPVS